MPAAPNSAAAARRARRGGARIPLLLLALAALALGALGWRGARFERAELAFNNGAEIASLDPALARGVPEGRVLRALYEGLVTLDGRTLEPSPGVAESWSLSADGCSYRFELRADARWSDGSPVEAEDFACSYERLLDPRTGAPNGPQLYVVRGARAFATERAADGGPLHAFDTVAIRCAGPRQLEIELERPCAHFLQLLALPALLPISRRALERARADFGARYELEWLRPEHIVGNGAFRLSERRLNERMRLTRSPTYWNARAVGLASVDCYAIENLGTALNLYLAGELDWLTELPPQWIGRLLERPDFRPAAFLGVYFYRFNCTRPPLDDARVRTALALAIDREALVRGVTRAGELPAFGFVPPGMPGHRGASLAHASRERDLERARALLREAGYGPGAAPLRRLALAYNTQTLNKDVAEVVASDWRAGLGIEVALENREWKVFLDAQKALDFDISRSSWIGDWADAANFLEIFASGGENNRTGWSSAAYDELIARAAAETAPAARAELLHAAEQRLLDELPITPLYFYVSKNLVRPELAGFEPNLLDLHPLHELRWRAAGGRTP